MGFLKQDNFKRDAFLGIVVWLFLLIFFFIVPSAGIHDIIQKVFILGLFAMSLNILIGYLGLIAFGHAAFFAAGAYTLGLFLQSNVVNILGSLSFNAAKLPLNSLLLNNNVFSFVSCANSLGKFP